MDAALQQELDERNEEHEPAFYLMLNEAQCAELSFGRVPALVQEMAKTLCDWTLEDVRKNAMKHARPKNARRRS